MADHSDLQAGAIHIPYNWTYANAAAMNAASGFVAGDVGKLARLLDTNDLYILTAVTPTWTSISGAITVQESDGVPSVATVDIQFPVGTVTDEGSGVVSVDVQLAIPDYIFSLDGSKATTDEVDDEFSTTDLDAKWNVVDGVLGTCSMFASTGDTYDVTTRPGWLLMQSDNGNHIKLRQDFTLADGYSILMAISPCTLSSSESGIVNNQTQVGMVLNDGDSDQAAGNYVITIWDTSLDGWRILANNQAGTAYSTPAGDGVASCPIAARMYFRIARAGLTYYPFWSNDGTTWMPLGPGYTFAGALDNLWIINLCNSDPGDPVPIQAVDWVRQGGNGLDPW